MNVSRSFLIGCVLILQSFAQSGCSEQKKEAGPATVTERFDAYSAPLYKATQKALAQDFDIQLLDGNRFSMSGQQGKVVLINLWASWCVPCLDETPDLVDLYKEYGSKGFVVLGVSIDEQGISVVQPFIDKFGVSYPVYIDSKHLIQDKYGPTMGIPTTYIIDRTGHMRYFAVGALTRKELEPRIVSLLKEES